jgi:hypothetical protein
VPAVRQKIHLAYCPNLRDRLLTPLPGGSASKTRTLEEVFNSCTNIVLLGDPGSGKSFCLKGVAGRCNALYIRARDFLNNPTITKHQSLFIDGLDEKRSGHGDQDTVDAMVRKLFKVDPSTVCISCRAVDWLGETDLAAFNTYFDRVGGVTVVRLRPLSSEDQVQIAAATGIADPQRFLDDARRRGLREFLGNPQSLIMLSEVVSKKGQWPATRSELFNEATTLLLDETNIEHVVRNQGSYTGAELRGATGALFALRLISDTDGICSIDYSARNDIPTYRVAETLGIDLEKLKAVTTRRVFTSIGDNRIDYVCSPSATMRLIEVFHERRIFGSS